MKYLGKEFKCKKCGIEPQSINQVRLLFYDSKQNGICRRCKAEDTAKRLSA